MTGNILGSWNKKKDINAVFSVTHRDIFTEFLLLCTNETVYLHIGAKSQHKS